MYQQSLVFVQCVINALFALVALKLTSSGGDEVDRTPTYMYLWCSMSYMGAMLASNTALRWVNYPTQVHRNKSFNSIIPYTAGVDFALESGYWKFQRCSC